MSPYKIVAGALCGLLPLLIDPAQAAEPPGPEQAAAGQFLPPELFFGPPQINQAVLSPSGRFLAVSTPVGQKARVGLHVIDLSTMTPLPKRAALFSDADIYSFHWVDDERLVFDVADNQSGGGDQRFWPGLFSVNRDGGDQRLLVDTSGSFLSEMRIGRQPLSANHSLLHVPAPNRGEVVVAESTESSGDFGGTIAKRLNVRTGQASGISRGVPDHVYQWMFDAAGEPRFVLTRHQGRLGYWWKAEGGQDWKQVGDFPVYRAPWTPVAYHAGAQLFVTVSYGPGSWSELRRFDLATGKLAEEALVRTPGFDFRGRILSETDGSPALGVRVLTDAESTVWFDARLAALQKEADARWPATINRLVCRRCDQPDMRVLMFSWSDRDPGRYRLYSAADQRWVEVGSVRGSVPVQRMATTDFERITARDGLEIPVWITRPAPRPMAAAAAGTAAAARPPAVVLVHGGPWVRGRYWRWDEKVQFLASRGYVVIEPEFRGSTGYGQRLFRAGFKQFGRAMQDDVADAVLWAAGKGEIDPKRVCIAGASYGGYATLMGLARHPELYRCGVAWVAVSDPRLMFRWRNDYDVGSEGREFTYPALIGDPVADAAMLESVAPVLLADKIKAPLLLAHGALDRRVPMVHGERMRAALQAVGRPPEWVVYDDEGHGWFKRENRLDFARRLEAFLARHLQ